MTAHETNAASPSFTCSLCGTAYRPSAHLYTCTTCGPDGVLEPARPRRSGRVRLPVTLSAGMWRYENLLAVSPGAPRPPLPVGGTPLVRIDRLARRLGLEDLYVKNDSLNPTGSLKDRASAVVLARAAELAVERVAVASTGNAGSSLAGLAASMGIPTSIFVPERAPRAKLLQSLAYGAQVFAVRGSYDDAFELCLAASKEYGWFNRNTAHNPFTIEGKKTVSFEIYEQLGNRLPDVVLVPTGDGCILSGVARGFRDLRDLGLTDRIPRLIAVQAEGSCAIALALENQGQIPRISAHSVADSITVDFPRNGAMAVRDVRESGGRAVVVTDKAILSACGELARETGIFAEPAAAAPLAALHTCLAKEAVRRDEVVVLLVTGSGLKDVDAAAAAVGQPVTIDPSLQSLRAGIAAKL